MNSTAPAKSEPKPRLWPVEQLVDGLLQEALQAYEAKQSGQPFGPITGLKRLDLKIGGSLPKEALTVILGNTGAGKTAFAGQIAAHAGCPTVYLTTEMTPIELLRRHTARVTSTFLGRLKSGEMTPSDIERLVRQTTSVLSRLSIVDGTTAYAPVSYLKEVVEIAKGEAAHVLLIVDSLHTWARGSATGATEYDTLNEHLTALGRLAKLTGASIVVICEQSRAAMDGGGVNSGAGTRFIEYCADLVLDLRAKGVPDGSGEKAVTLTLAENRNGAAGEPLALEFNGALQRFREVDG